MKRFTALIAFLTLVFQGGIGLAQDASPINLRRTVAVEVVERTKDAVVNISSEKQITQRVPLFGYNPFFWEGNGPSQVRQFSATSLGSGFIIHANGYVVTNNHVIDRAREITVELADGRKMAASLISADPDADLAILKINSDKPLPVLELGDSSDLMIGEPTIAVGNPFGYSHTVSTGIVSALHRDIKDREGKVSLSELIQTDAAINPGNSGGPLLNAYGQVIGINTAIRNDAQNIGFAIQVNRLRDLIPELMNPALATKVDVPLQLIEQRRITPPANVHSQVVETGDPQHVVTSINGHSINNIVEAYAELLDAKVGRKLTVALSDGQTQQVTPQAVPLPDAIVQARKRLGITVELLTPMLAQKYGLNAEDGLLVREVAATSVASRTGIEAGDIIVQLGRYRVSTLNDLSALIGHLPEAGRVRVSVIRQDHIATGWLVFGDDESNL